MSIEIESYIAKTKDFVIRDINKMDESLFLNVAAIQEVDKKKIDSNYIYGVLLIKYNGAVILGFKEYDLIDQLLMYFVDAIEKFKENSEVEFSFPDQPFPVRIEKKGGDFCTLSLNDQKTALPETDFIRSMLEAAEFFFNQLLLLFPEEHFFIKQNIDDIDKVKKKYGV